MPRLVNQKSLEAVFAELPNQFTLKELKRLATKHEMNSQTVLRQGKARKVFVNLEYGVYSKVHKAVTATPIVKLEQVETVRHLGYIAQNTPGGFPFPTINFVVTRMQNILEAVAPAMLQSSLKSLEEEVMQLRMDLADALVEHPTEGSGKAAVPQPNPKATTPKELKELAEAYGWEWKRQSGSHHIFKHPGRPDPLAIPCANSNKSIGARASRLITTQILRGTKGQNQKK
jgi:predicted RNA binding protein YcfA (HicA-like mRNA interferase family)